MSGGKRKGAGRPRVGEVVAARFPPGLVIELAAYSGRTGITKANAVRRAVARGLGLDPCDLGHVYRVRPDGVRVCFECGHRPE